MAYEQFLVILVVTIALRLIGIITSSLLFCVSWTTGLIRRPSLLLIHILIMGDLTFFVFGLINQIYLVCNWDFANLSYDPVAFFITSLPIVFHDKNEATILLAIVIDRLLAVFSPSTYQHINHKYKAIVATILSVSAGLTDIYMFYILSPIVEHPSCAALGCFMTDDNRRIFGRTNMVLDFILIILTLIFLIKLRKMSTIYTENKRGKDHLNFMQINKTSLISLVTFACFVTIPSVFMGAFEQLVGAMNQSIGPLMSIFIVCSGILNSGLLLRRNKEFNKGLQLLLNREKKNIPPIQPLFHLNKARQQSDPTQTP